MRRIAIVIAFTAAAARAQSAAQLRAGESANGFPSWSERVILEWINRARVDPQIEMRTCGAACGDAACYTPQPPLYWSEALNHSARFHAAEMQQQNYFTHDSKCTVVSNINNLFPTACDGSASCACVGGSLSCASGGCTSWSGRVAMFGSSTTGEIIASPSDPNQAFYLWLYESASPGSCGFSSSNGHRWLMLTSQGAVGIGVERSAVGDFGPGGVAYRIPSAAHYPQQAASVEIWANWYDSAPPRSATAVVDGRCFPMSLKRGTSTSGAWSATATNVGSGCHRYYIAFIDATGAEVTYPVTGSLGIGCADWDMSRAQASCSGATPPPSNSRRRSARH